MVLSGGTFLAFNFPLLFVLFNHSSYRVDVSVLHVEGLNFLLRNSEKEFSCNDRFAASSQRQEELDTHAESCVACMKLLQIKARLKTIVESTRKSQKWHRDVQDLLQITFLVEFLFMGAILCFLLYSLFGSESRSIMVILLPFVFLPRLFVYCFMGTRLVIKTERLTIALYNSEWHLMDRKQQKDLQMIILMSQNMKEFNGIFMPVNLGTFKEV